MHIGVVVFDFDGVIVLNSDQYKNEAWLAIFKNEVGRYENFLKQANSLFGWGKKGGRREIITYVLERLYPDSDVSVLVEERVSEFSLYVYKNILREGLVQGVVPLLETLRDRGFSIYINSGTSTKSLRESLEALGILSFFKEVLGSTCEPRGGSKVENMHYIFNKEKVAPDNVLFVGDGESDVLVSKQVACKFVGLPSPGNTWHKNPPSVPIAEKIEDILTIIDFHPTL
jgi:phosphoglycolate phosphatase-like HAD superfamily hydrolase